MLKKELLRVTKRRPNIYPQFVEEDREELAGEVIEAFSSCVGEKRRELQKRLNELEEFDNFKLVRGLAALLERKSRFQLSNSLQFSPRKIRSLLYEKGFVVGQGERKRALEELALELSPGLEEDELEKRVSSLDRLFWADRESEEVLQRLPRGRDGSPPPLLEPDSLLRSYNLSLAQTLLFDALELRFRAEGNFQEIFRRIKYNGLMYHVRQGGGEGKESLQVEVTGPAALFHKTRKYGVALAKVLPAIIEAEGWEIVADVETEVGGQRRVYKFSLSDDRRGLFPESFSGVEPETDYDSKVEGDLARRLSGVKKDWNVVHEPTILKSGPRVMIPDFEFELRGVSHYLEVVGFWTEEYLRKKIDKVKGVDVPLTIAVDKNLNCEEEDFLGLNDKEVITYDKKVPLEPILKKLSQLEEDQKKEEIARLRKTDIELPDDNLVELSRLAQKYEVGVGSLLEALKEEVEECEEWVLLNRRLVKREWLEEGRRAIDELPLDGPKEGEKAYEEVKEILESYGFRESDLSKLGYKVNWHQLMPPIVGVKKKD